MEVRKQEEREFHNLMRDEELRLDAQRSNKKFYSIVRRERVFIEDWLRARAEGRNLLDYGCGNGGSAIRAAQMGYEVTAVDISDVSVRNARRSAIREGVAERIKFYVMDCESLAFRDNSFDVIHVSGVLHHLDIQAAFPELARVVKPEGEILCAEGLANNPVIHLYRKMTPHLRTPWEVDHILRVRDVRRARAYFGRIESRFFHLATIAAVPFRNTRNFRGILRVLEAIDSIILRVPLLRTQAWVVVFILSCPRKALSC